MVTLLSSACTVTPPPIEEIDVTNYRDSLNTNASDIGSLILNDAVTSYNNQYQKARYHKAFAQSKSGAWAWHQNFANIESLIESTLELCDKHNSKSATKPCKIININGYWASEF